MLRDEMSPSATDCVQAQAKPIPNFWQAISVTCHKSTICKVWKRNIRTTWNRPTFRLCSSRKSTKTVHARVKISYRNVWLEVWHTAYNRRSWPSWGVSNFGSASM